ncbi:hypothetical protein CLV24_107168 [Pontibacter ummariensis]|uniref:Uncharacterized protein n=1 Tax=Pontibacter ummariensis TaxID=1610492 RepID=A0A239ERU0_9BACT|nr:ACT domain-containing protein [Pontibacter ummariensis]PRY12795.1 hypothetical protein CLV24_107168 [Pontibacter ummariensis]SNS46968.1 hypothetical protein SAMN06296052_10720 [Pontibacter ummariensis]
MAGEKDLAVLLRSLTPVLNEGAYVFCTVPDLKSVAPDDIISLFKEKEGLTVILAKDKADALGLPYGFVASWITLTVHSSLEAVGLTAAFSRALAQNGISCNVVAGFYHDHIFVSKQDAKKAMQVLQQLSEPEKQSSSAPKS